MSINQPENRTTMKSIKNTQKALDQLSFSETRVEYAVENEKHMRVITSKTRITLYVKINHNNKRYSQKVGCHPEVSFTAFKQLSDQLREEVTSPYTHYSDITFAEYFIREYAPHAKGKLKSYKDCVSRYKTHLHHAIGPKPIKDIRPKDIRKLIDSMAQNKSPATCNRVLSLISSVMKLAYLDGLLRENPCAKVRSLRERNIIDRTMTDGEVEAYVEVCLEDFNSLQTLALYSALLTGMRIGNICSLKKSYIDFDAQEATLPETKSGKPLTLPLSFEANRVLKHASRLSGGSEYVFASSRSKTGHIAYPDSAFFSLCQKAGIATRKHTNSRPDFPSSPLTIHCLRKTVCTRLLRLTGDLTLCRDLMGHSDVKVTQRYAFTDKTHLKSALEQVF